MRTTLVWVIAIVLAARPAAAWVVRESPPDAGRWESVVVAPDGNPVAVGWTFTPPHGTTRFRVEKMSADDGSVLWNHTGAGLLSVQNAYGLRVGVDAAGDVLAGALAIAGSEGDSVVVKLSGSSGAVVWRRDVGGLDVQNFADMAVAANGDVVLATSEGTVSTTNPVVRRLAAATGADVWSTTLATGTAGAVAIDAAGNVLVGGVIGTSTTLTKLDGATGGSVWSASVPSTSVIEHVVVDAAGDVVTTGYFVDDPFVFASHGVVTKASGADGTNAWHWDLVPSSDIFHSLAVRLDPTGNVYVGGASDKGLRVVRLAGGSGAETWRRELPAKYSSAGAVVVSPGGVPAVAGILDTKFTVASFAPATGETYWIEQLPGTSTYVSYAEGLAFGGGYLFAAGSSVALPTSSDDAPHEPTMARWIDPSAPPIIGSCSPSPRADCREPTTPLASALAIRDVAGTGGDTLKWKLTRGAATTLAELGDPPTAGADWTLCLYDASATPIFSVAIPSGGTCAGLPCWRAAGTKGFSYKSARPREPEGLDKLKLAAGVDGAVKVGLTRKGRSGIDLPIPPVATLVPPFTLQLQRAGGICFGADFTAAGLIKHDAITLKIRGD